MQLLVGFLTLSNFDGEYNVYYKYDDYDKLEFYRSKHLNPFTLEFPASWIDNTLKPSIFVQIWDILLIGFYLNFLKRIDK